VADIPVHLEAVDFHIVNATRIAKLVKCPRTLHLLWAEYILGFTGHKPASEFTQAERGADRYNYYRRNVFWMKVIDMCKLGYKALSYCSIEQNDQGQEDWWPSYVEGYCIVEFNLALGDYVHVYQVVVVVIL
jgi:hypothetical protein